MFAIIGILIVLGAVGLGFFFEKGNFSLLFSAAPAEMLIILGGAFGAMVLGAPKEVLGQVFSGILGVFGSMKTSKAYYLDMLTVLSQLFMKIRREGLVAIEKDIEHPTESPIFSSFAKNKANVAVVRFICDTMRIFSTVNIEQHEFDNIMEADIEAAAHEAMTAAHTMGKTADGLPGLGIVAAVLGVVITMGKINEPPEVLGHSIGAALVGTMLGVLGCYGFLGPIAQNMEMRAKELESSLVVVKAALGAFVGGNPPPVALEAGRRAIPTLKRPTFEELEEAIKISKGK
ncbi:flagellar motor stator protein MotA [Desulfolutivibrio sulfoxidireducens]|uniref:flagellar motor stator protein MotA n=1 Tax=Desulfolutivibrio sulfoxidireducens TaxID=2773299 RepID=UPI00159DB449|nr:flagellar motor stator protein MotA [Desulfolutivibrio sulfoxidireducens]QLA15284.1 flagellar motor stator protein MotA [Desulfolutivibrio sulfoxidireducens]QLA18856.1 flagellar motor stator protein MotA [Desulfolutivibrio sulfoxidireducens]